MAWVDQAAPTASPPHKDARAQRRIGRALALLWFVLLTSVIAGEVAAEQSVTGQIVVGALALAVLLFAIFSLWHWELPMAWFLVTIAPLLSIVFPLWAANIGLHPIGLVAVDVLCLVLPSLAGGVLLLDGRRRSARRQELADPTG